MVSSTYYYNLYSTQYAFFKSQFEKTPWPPVTSQPSTDETNDTVITYYNQTPLYVDKECTIPAGTAQVSWEWTEHTIDGVIQPFVDTIGLFLSEGNELEASLVTDVNVFEVNKKYVYRVFESAGDLRDAISVSFFRGEDNIVTVKIRSCEKL